MGGLELTYVYMWGRKRLCGHTNSEDERAEYDVKAPVLLRNLELKRIIAISCANLGTIALTAYGQTLYWRFNVPQPVEELKNLFITKITSNTPGLYNDQFAVIDESGDIYCWETINEKERENFCKLTFPASTAVSVVCGDGTFMGLAKDSNVYIWMLPTPVAIPLVALAPEYLHSKVTQIGIGNKWFHAARTIDNNLYTWGAFKSPSGGNYLAHHSTMSPTIVEPLRNKVAYFSCDIHMMAVTLDGEVYGWGDGDTNRLGHGLEYRERHRDEPTLIKDLCGKEVKKLSLTRGNEAALTQQGEVYLWGGMDFGGHHCYRTPTKLHMDTLEMQQATIRDVSCGRSHTAILTIVSMTLKHLCFRTIALSLEKFPECSEKLPLELREAMANFLSDRLILDSFSVKILGVDPELFNSKFVQTERYY